MPERDQAPPSTIHYRLEQLAHGVYSKDNGEGTAVGNAGIVDLGDETLIFDTFITPLAARELRKVAEQLTGRVAKWVVNSHYHNDHIRGNQVIPDATVLSSERTRQQILTDGLEDLPLDTALAPPPVDGLRQQIQDAPDASVRDEDVCFSIRATSL